MIHYETCPVCKSREIESSFLVKDFSVSGRDFPLWTCRTCTLRFTQDVPIQEEIGAYYQSSDYISHSETRKGLVNQLYHLVRRVTLKQKRKLINKLIAQKKGTILDIGCGTGAFLEEMQKSGWKAIGLEPDESARKIAISRNLNVHPAEDLFQLRENVDVITMWHVLEHVHDLHRYLTKVAGVLNQDGVLLVAVPNYTAYDQLAYQQYWAAYDVPRHLYHFSPASIRALMEKHGFRVEKMLPMWFDSFYVSMLSEKYRSGNVNYVSAVLHALQSNVNAIGNPQKCSSVIYVLKKQLG